MKRAMRSLHFKDGCNYCSHVSISLKPIEIRRVSAQLLRVTWSDGAVQELSSQILRANCPCALCVESRAISIAPPAKKSALNIVDGTLNQQVSLEEVWSVGQYAIGARWGDGHNTGIYTYDYLRSLSA